MNNSPESDPIKHLHALTTKAGEALGDDAAFDAAIGEINERLRAAELEHLDKLIGITKQYESQVAVLRSARIVFQLSDGSKGIFDKYGTEYPIPSLLSIVQRFCEDGARYELLRRKVEQGFTKLILVPFAPPLQTLVDSYTERLRLHRAAGELFREGESPAANPGKAAEVLHLNTEEPVWKWTGYNAFSSVYFPTSFDLVNHGGLTKPEAISQKGAWQVYLVEETPIPKKGKGASKNGRQQLEAGLSAIKYLQKLQTDPQYKGETGLTTEAWLMRAMTHLEERGEISDDQTGKGSATYILGTRFHNSSSAAIIFWSHGRSQAVLGREVSTHVSDGCGASSAVPI